MMDATISSKLLCHGGVRERRIFDLITTWHTRGLYKSFLGRPEVEIMWYSAGAYLTAESIVAAYTLLEQTSSIQHQFKRLAGYIKETIVVVNDYPLVQGEYYVSRMSKQEILIKHLKKHMTEEGEVRDDPTQTDGAHSPFLTLGHDRCRGWSKNSLIKSIRGLPRTRPPSPKWKR